MKRLLTILLLSVLTLTLSAQGDYASLWKLYEKAQEKDQPKTALSHIRKIEKKAEKEKLYGHLLAALFTESSILTEISPDSIVPMELRMEAKYKELEKTEPIAAILYRIAKEGSDRDIVDSLLHNTTPEIAKELTEENGALKYVPLVKKGSDSKYFNHDLISLIAHTTVDYEPLVRYYSEQGNRKAACIMAALMLDDVSGNEQEHLATQLQKADSLIAVYGDLNECGAIAVRKWSIMNMSEHNSAQNIIAWIDEAVKRWPQWQEINILKNEKNLLTRPTLTATIRNKQLTTKQEAKISFESVRNISSVIVKATPIVGLMTDDATKLIFGGSKDLIKFKKYLKKDAAISVSKKFAEHKNHEIFEDSISLGSLPLGLYYIEILCDNDYSNEYDNEGKLLIVSDLSVISLQQSTNQIRYVVVNSNTSKPVAGANLHITMRDDTKQVYTTNEDGEYIFNNTKENEPREVFATFKDDNAQQSDYRHHSFYEYKKERSIIDFYKIFTDRSLYRPGQTVHASIIAYNLTNSETTKVLPNKEITLTLRNAEYKDVTSVKVTTDEFGVAAADFILPEHAKNGSFTINTNKNATTRFRVEEYVRPTFEVTLNKPEIKYKDGDTISVTGTAKTYSGVAVSNAKVAYTVCRNKSWWWRRDYDKTDLLEDSVMTDASGNFTIKMPMILPRDRKSKISPLHYWLPMFYDIKATAVVTDMTGESHEAQLSLPLSNRATALTSDIKDKYLKNDKPIEVVFTRRNNAGTEIEGEVAITIDGKEEEKAVCGKSYALPTNLPSGSHFIKAICGNDTIEQKFVLFSLEDKVPATKTNDWWYATGNEFPATIQFGTCEKDVYAVYSIFSGSKLIESGSLKMDSSLVTRKFEYKEEYGDGICYTIAWVRNGECHTHAHTIKRPLPNKSLMLNWTTFRNKLEPGQKEQWQLSITDCNGKPANANVIAVLYDKSLDALSKHDWLFRDYRTIYQSRYGWQAPNHPSFYFSYNKDIKFLETKDLDFSVCGKGYTWKKRTTIRIRGYSAQETSVLYEKSPRLLAKAAPLALDDLSDNGSIGEVKKAKVASLALSEQADNVSIGEAKEEKNDRTDVQIRTNLNETAFFMPQLRTDDKGIATLSFTLPESVTTWKLMAFAHDKEVKFGTLTDEVIAQKKLMIQPRLPRFLREGDVTDISASVSNLTEKDITATVKFTILDAKTEKVLSTQSKNITIKGGETEAVSFAYDSKNQEDKSIIVRYTVSGKSDEGTFSDGEQKDLPILSQKELMVNTKTFILAEEGTKQFDINDIMPTVNEKHLTVEYTDNPEWLMIKSLPYISKANDDCAICLVAAYYANSLASSIAHSNPDIQKAVKEWNSEEMTQLFDSLSSGNRKTDALERLTQLQNNDGSWSWWKGMDGSTCMTVQVLKTLLRLNLMMNDEKVKKQNEKLIRRGLAFLDKETAKRVAEMKKEKYKYLPYYALDYLYCRAIAKASGLSINSDSNADYLLKLVPEETRYDDMHTKAQAAIIMSFLGNKSKADEFIKSIIEHTVYRDDLGRYFDSDRAAYSWCDYRIPTQVSVIEALKLIDGKNSAKEIAEMKRWLLQSKRTQSWDTPINAIDAIYAFLCPSQGTTTSLKNGVPADMALGKTRLEAQEYTSALGYVKTSKDITSKDKVLAFTKHTNSESWANVFIEYKQAATESSESSTGLSITRKVETKNNELKVGDKVKVTITITADRDYDFVTVTDNRPACLEPVEQLSGYSNGTYKIVRDTKTEYCYNMMRKGTHVIKTSYYVARTGNYTSGTATATCTYSPVFTGRTPGSNYVVK